MTKFRCAYLIDCRCAGAARVVRGAVRASAGTDELDITQVQNNFSHTVRKCDICMLRVI